MYEPSENYIKEIQKQYLIHGIGNKYHAPVYFVEYYEFEEWLYVNGYIRIYDYNPEIELSNYSYDNTHHIMLTEKVLELWKET